MLELFSLLFSGTKHGFCAIIIYYCLYYCLYLIYMSAFVRRSDVCGALYACMYAVLLRDMYKTTTAHSLLRPDTK